MSVLSDEERASFEAWVFDTERVHPTTWDAECAKYGQEPPKNKKGLYYFSIHNRLWEAWQARAMLAAAPEAPAEQAGQVPRSTLANVAGPMAAAFERGVEFTANRAAPEAPQ